MKHLYIFNSKSPLQLLCNSIIFAIPFLMGLLFFYFIFYRDFLYCRDLGRMGMMNFDSTYQNCVDTLTTNLVSEINTSEISTCDKNITVISMGDSFSQQGRRGYMNYLANMLPEYQFYNIKNPTFSDPEIKFMHICLANDTMPKIVILESVERLCINRLCNLKFYDELHIRKNDQIKKERTNKKKSFVQWAQEYYKKRLGIDNPVGHFQLTTNTFSCKKHEKDLYFIEEDLHIPNSDLITLAQLKLDSLFQFAAERDIQLYYLVAADKYDIYQKYIAKEHPQKNTLDQLSEHFKGNKYFINSKELILPYIHSGEKDMYYCDDTHWSTKSAKLVGEEIARRIAKK